MLRAALGLALAGWASGCSLVLVNDFTFPDGAAPDGAIRDGAVRDGGPPDATPGDGGTECAGPTDCPSAPFSTATCVDGLCGRTCDGGRGDCDGLDASGCETSLDDDRMHCGGCATVCDAANASPSCAMGECVYVCATGFADCDTASPDCETALGTGTDCASCGDDCGTGNFCDTSAGAAMCAAECLPPGTACGDACVSTATNVQHCGGCDRPCAGSEAMWACASGACAVTGCNAGYGDCNLSPTDGCETNVSTSLSHCGACGSPCAPAHASGACASGACGIASCDAGYTDCDGDPSNGCEARLTDDPLHCGACGHACASGAACVSGVCDPVIDVAPGALHTCALRASGVVSCWGANEAGQLGDGTLDERAVPAPIVSSARFARIVAGQSFTCGIDDTGHLRCWGRGGYGELGDGTGANRAAPVAVTARAADATTFATRTFTDLAPLRSGACALDDVGEVWCWGRNTAGEVGDGTTTAALRAARVAGIAGVLGITAGENHVCARTAAAVSCWGANGFGQLGDGTTTNRSAPTPVGSLGATSAIEAGSSHTCAILAGGNVSCWGRNDAGDLGVAGPSTATPTPNGVTADRLACGQASCIAHGAGGHVAWGLRADGQHGDGTEGPPRTSPTSIPLPTTAVVTYSLPGTHVCGVDGGRLSCWGNDANGQLGVRDLVVRAPAPVADGAGPISGIAQIATGSFTTFVVRSGALYGAGANNLGLLQPGAPAASAIPIPHPSVGNPVRSFAATGGAACAVVGLDGARQVRCWGSSPGIAASANASVTAIAGGEPTAIALGYAHACAIVLEPDGDRVPYCWGSNMNGALGGGTTGGTDAVPTAVTGAITDAVEVELGHDFGCARRASGAVMCWGTNVDGRVGDGSMTARPSPTPVSGLTDAIDLAVGSTHACALRMGGAIVCWGNGTAGQLGDGAMAFRTTPVPVVGVPSASAVVAGGTHSCALASGTPTCWGDDHFGQLGRGARGPTGSPPTSIPAISTAVGLVAARGTAVSANHTCALLSDGSARCWGIGTLGRLGSGEDLTLPTPMLALLPY